MIQWLQSKLVLIVAGLILISSITTMFYIQTRSFEREELMDHCSKISRVIEEVDNLDADIVRQKISFDEDFDGFYVTPEVGGETYTVKIYQDFVKLETESKSVTSDLEADIHLWELEDLNNSGHLGDDEKNWRDSQAEPLEIEAGDKDILLRKVELDCDGSNRSHIFVSEVDIS